MGENDNNQFCSFDLSQLKSKEDLADKKTLEIIPKTEKFEYDESSEDKNHSNDNEVGNISPHRSSTNTTIFENLFMEGDIQGRSRKDQQIPQVDKRRMSIGQLQQINNTNMNLQRAIQDTKGSMGSK